MSSNHCIVDVLLPIPSENLFSYIVPNNLVDSVKVGQWIRVPLRYRISSHGIIISIQSNNPHRKSLKKIEGIIDNERFIPKENFEWWNWIAKYYMTTVGSVYKMAIPPKMHTLYNEVSLFEKEKFLKLNSNIDEKKLNDIIDKLKNAPQQKKLLFKYLESENYSSQKHISGILKKDILKHSNVGVSSVKGLLNKKILIEVESIYKKNLPDISLPKLSSDDKSIYGKLEKLFNVFEVIVFQSAEIERDVSIISHLIYKHLLSGETVLYLFSEINELKKAEKKLQPFFKDYLITYHAQKSLKSKIKIWKKVRESNTGHLCLGVKSAIFLPFQKLGLIIIDNEHSKQYKQQIKTPYFHARDAAIMLAKYKGAKTLLYDATPSFETNFNIAKKKYGHFEIPVNPQNFSKIIVKDINEEKRKKMIIGHFSPQVLDEIKLMLDEQKQVVVYKNRKGFANYCICEDCSHVIYCQHCDVSLTYHKLTQNLKCRYCGFMQRIPEKCEKCGSNNLRQKGTGIESIKEELKSHFNEFTVENLDSDLPKNEQINLLNKYNSGQIHLLVTTQLGLNRLNFKNVGGFIIPDADYALNMPDFRAEERFFQQLFHIALKLDQAKNIFLQTQIPNHQVFMFLAKYNYNGFFKSKISERKQFVYPPFYRFIEIELKSKNKNILSGATQQLNNVLKQKLGIRVFGVFNPGIERIKDYYIKKIIVKIEPKSDREKIKDIIWQETCNLLLMNAFKMVLIKIDIDPQ